jgi:hypothetical protein
MRAEFYIHSLSIRGINSLGVKWLERVVKV